MNLRESLVGIRNIKIRQNQRKGIIMNLIVSRSFVVFKGYLLYSIPSLIFFYLYMPSFSFYVYCLKKKMYSHIITLIFIRNIYKPISHPPSI